MADGAGSDFDLYLAGAGARLLKLAYLLTGNLADADDLVQESLGRAFVAWPRVLASADRDAYVRRIMVNANRRRFRRRRVTEDLDGQCYEHRVHERAGAQDDFAVVEDRCHLAAGLAVLPQRQRTAVVLRYYEDLSEADVATVMGCSVGTVKSQTSKALAKLRSHPSLGVNLSTPQRNGVSHA